MRLSCCATCHLAGFLTERPDVFCHQVGVWGWDCFFSPISIGEVTATEDVSKNLFVIARRLQGARKVGAERTTTSNLVIVKMLFSPKVISMTPSSHPALNHQLSRSRGADGHCRSVIPRMTFPVPIGVLKSPRPIEESNLPSEVISA